MVQIGLTQFNNEHLKTEVWTTTADSDKLAQIYGHIAKEIVGLSKFLHTKVYHFPKLFEANDELERLIADISRSISQ